MYCHVTMQTQFQGVSVTHDVRNQGRWFDVLIESILLPNFGHSWTDWAFIMEYDHTDVTIAR